jgi:hypothetical protein
MASRTPEQIALEIEQEERVRRKLEREEQLRRNHRREGANKLRELFAMLEKVQGRYNAIFKLTEEPDLAVVCQIAGQFFATWERDGATLRATFMRQPLPEVASSAEEAFRTTIKILVSRQLAA